MIVAELRYRAWGIVLCLAAVGAATGLLAGVWTRLAAHDLQSERMLSQKEAETKAKMAHLQQEVKSAMHRLGYNAIILPKDQSLVDWYDQDYAAKTMPAETAERLAGAGSLAERYVTRLRRKLKWTESRRNVIVVGVGQERVLEAHISNPAPLAPVIPRGACRLGYELHAAGSVRQGDAVVIEGKSFKVVGCEPETGTKDDITVWLTLDDAQELLGLPGLINEILIVEHASVWGKTDEVKRRVAQALPECQVIEIASQTQARLHARLKVAEEAVSSIRAEREKRAALRASRRMLLLCVGAVSFAAVALLTAIMMYQNVRERTGEIAILTAIGFQTGQLRRLVLGKTAFVGLFGGILGTACGWLAAGGPALPLALTARVWGTGVAVALCAGMLGVCLPARSIGRLDPAPLLAGE